MCIAIILCFFSPFVYQHYTLLFFRTQSSKKQKVGEVRKGKEKESEDSGSEQRPYKKMKVVSGEIVYQ